jgi:ribosomal protein S17
LRNETDAIHFNSISGIKIFRPLSKTVRFNVLKVIPAGSTGGGGKKAFAAV